MVSILATKTKRNGKPVIALGFPYDPETIRKVKTIPGRVYEPAKRSGYLPDRQSSIEALKNLFEKGQLQWKHPDVPSIRVQRSPTPFNLKQRAALKRYEQTIELNGLSNPKATKKYTHITLKGMDQVKSPFDRWKNE